MSGQCTRLPKPIKLEFWSPSSYNQLRRCGLALAYDRDPEIRSSFRRGNTFSALGKISHALTEKLLKGKFNGVPADQLRSILAADWEVEAEKQYAGLANEWFPAVPPNHTEWPFHAMSKQRTLLRLCRDAEAFRHWDNESAKGRKPLVEAWMKDPKTNLRGRADLVQPTATGYRVVDLKSGVDTQGINGAHLRQLVLYAHLVRVETGVLPTEVAITNARGESFERSISADEVDSAVQEFRLLTSEFDAKIDKVGFDIGDATPSPDVCRHCSYRGVCPAFEAAVEESWGARTLKGIVSSIESPRSFTFKATLPHERHGDELSVVFATDLLLSVGMSVVCVDVYADTTTLRVEWNSRFLF